MNKVLYFDICAIPIFAIIICTTITRGMTKGRTNKLYLSVSVFSFVTAVSELLEKVAYMQGFPITGNYMILIKIAEYIYFLTRNAINVTYLLFVISMTKRWYGIKPLWKKLLILMPYLVVVGMLAANEHTGWVFTVTPEAGYSRGSCIFMIYLMALSYMVFGSIYLIVNRKTLDKSEWFALFSMYLINLAAVGFQFVYPQFLIESFATSLTVMFVVIYVRRPEKQVDMSSGLPGYRAFCDEMTKISVTGHGIKIVIVCLQNAQEMSKYLKDTYYSFVHTIYEQIHLYARKEKIPCEMYFERPGSFYLILEDESYNPVQAIQEIRDRIRKNGTAIAEAGAQPEPRIVTVNFPSEISSIDELLRFGHNFVRFADYSRIYSRASVITGNRSYQVEAHIDEILDRAVNSGGLKIRYQPTMSVKDNRFTALETVIELHDEIYGDIDAELLISAAEERGLIEFLGNRVTEEVFAFAGRDNMIKAGYFRVYVSMSVSRCMQMNITDIIWNLREKYRVDPSHIAFEIRESAYENMSSVFNENLKKLSAQGYAIVLDGFGRGYTNMQHLLDMPIKAVRLDKSLVLSAAGGRGKEMLRGIIQMLKGIPLEVIAQGADDKETADMLCDMGCDMIQGSYYADPADKETLSAS